MINATDDQTLAESLWGNPVWVEALGQFVPAEGGKSSPGISSSTSTSSSEKPSGKSRNSDSKPAPTTASRTAKDRTDSSGARSTATDPE